MHVANDFLVGFTVENKSEVQPIIEESRPQIGTGTAQKNEVVVRVQIGKPDVSSHLNIDLSCCTLSQLRNACDDPRINGCSLVSTKDVFAERNHLGRERTNIRNEPLVGIVREGNGRPRHFLDFYNVRIAGYQPYGTRRLEKR